MLAAAGGTWLTATASDTASIAEQALRAAGGVLIGLVAAVILIFAFNLVIAPYRQRNEARKRLHDLEAEANKPKLFDVFAPTTSVGLPLNRLDDGSYRASAVGVSFGSAVIAHRDELTTVTRLTALPQIRFTQADGQGWETTNAIQVAPGQNPMAGPGAMDFTWDTSNSRQWVLAGLPFAMARDNVLPLPMMMVTVADGDEAGAHFEKGETCTLTIRLAIRTDKGSPPLPDQVIALPRSDIRDSEWFQRLQQETMDETKQ